MKNLSRYGTRFFDEIKKDNVYKMGDQYVITGKGQKWNEAKNDIEELYKSWIEACAEIGMDEDHIIERLDNAELCKEANGNEVVYYFSDSESVVGQPFVLREEQMEENKVDLLLLLLFISSKLKDASKNKIRNFVKLEYVS